MRKIHSHNPFDAKSQMCFRAGEVELALLALTHLSSMLEQHIEKPHQYHIQANLSAKLCIMSKFLQKAIWEARAFEFEKRRFPPTLLNGELVTFEMPKFEGMPEWIRRADEPPNSKTKNRRWHRGLDDVRRDWERRALL